MKKNDSVNNENISDESVSEENVNAKIPAWIHITCISIIVLVLIFSIYKLVRWNMGTAKTEGVTGENYEVEVLDQIFLLPDEKKAGHEDDGVETILFLGNDAITYDVGDTGVVKQIGSKLEGSNVINAGFPGSTVALKNADYSDDYVLDTYSFYNVAKCIVNEDFTPLKDKTGSFEDSQYILSSEALEETDFSKVDTLVIYYNAQDYLNLRVGMNPDNDSDPVTFSGALKSGIQMIQEKYPYIRIVCMSFPMCYAYDSTGSLVSGDRYDFGNGKLTTYLQFMIDVSGATGVSFIDNYYGTIHEDNSSTWLLDNIHVNAECNAHIAEHFVSAIYPSNGNEEN